MTHSVAFLLGSGVAVFLVGANAAFLINVVGLNVYGWFRFKVVAITLLLVYVALTFATHPPKVGRGATVGFAAMAADVVALLWMWRSIDNLHSSGIKGYVPLIKPDDDRTSSD